MFVRAGQGPVHLHPVQGLVHGLCMHAVHTLLHAWVLRIREVRRNWQGGHDVLAVQDRVQGWAKSGRADDDRYSSPPPDVHEMDWAYLLTFFRNHRRIHCRPLHGKDVPRRADVPSVQDVPPWNLAIQGVRRTQQLGYCRLHAVCHHEQLPQYDPLLRGRHLRGRECQVQAVRPALRPEPVR